MKQRKVKALIVLEDLKQKDIADALGVSPTLVSLVIAGKKKSPRVRAAIAKALGMTIGQLWPNNNHGKKAA